eukprot:TRINITY_DN676_c0_g1_i2.p1 TRINITY_DN676_c0_g1~~TRINITY_DN676_c0_g1_i2.p1  ORF type:complete len:1685 (+),score=381.69 TRINITY_DN676_c0_g1_i2:242-5056(+)
MRAQADAELGAALRHSSWSTGQDAGGRRRPPRLARRAAPPAAAAQPEPERVSSRGGSERCDGSEGTSGSARSPPTSPVPVRPESTAPGPPGDRGSVFRCQISEVPVQLVHSVSSGFPLTPERPSPQHLGFDHAQPADQGQPAVRARQAVRAAPPAPAPCAGQVAAVDLAATTLSATGLGGVADAVEGEMTEVQDDAATCDPPARKVPSLLPPLQKRHRPLQWTATEPAVQDTSPYGGASCSQITSLAEEAEGTDTAEQQQEQEAVEGRSDARPSRCTFGDARAFAMSVVFAGAIVVGGGLWMYYEARAALEHMVEETSAADLAVAAREMQSAVDACSSAARALREFAEAQSAAALGGADSAAWAAAVRSWAAGQLRNSAHVQGVGAARVPSAAGAPFVEFVWKEPMDLLLPGRPFALMEARLGSHAPAPAPGQVQGSTAGLSPHSAAPYTVPRAELTAEPLPAGSPPSAWANTSGWVAGADGAAERWRAARAWAGAGDWRPGNPFPFLAVEVAAPAPAAPHPWSAAEAVVYRAQLDLDSLWFGDLGEGVNILAFERDSLIVYSASPALPSTGTGCVMLSPSCLVAVGNLSEGWRDAVREVLAAPRQELLVRTVGGSTHYVRQYPFSIFPPAVEAVIVWKKPTSAVLDELTGALVVVIIMGALTVLVIVGVVAFQCLSAQRSCCGCTAGSCIGASLALSRTERTNKMAMVRKWTAESAFQIRYWGVDAAAGTPARSGAAASTIQHLLHGVGDMGATQLEADYQIVQRLKELVECGQEVPPHNVLHDRDPVGASLFHWSVLQGSTALGNERARTIAKHLLAQHADTVAEQRYCRPQKAAKGHPQQGELSPGSPPEGLLAGARPAGLGPASAAAASARLAPFELGTYDGETALHMAVVLGDLEMVQLLLRTGSSRDTIRAGRAYGRFFGPERLWNDRKYRNKAHTYFGEYPLSFAVGAGNTDMAAELLSGLSNEQKLGELLRQDSFGNTALHVAVLHGDTASYDWVLRRVNEAGQACMRPEARDVALHVQGCLGLTPLGLAALRGGQQIFSHALESLINTEWVFGRVRCCSMQLQQVDTVPVRLASAGRGSAESADAGPQFISALDVLLRWHRLELATQDNVVSLLDAKWHSVRVWFYVSLVLHTMFVATLTALAVEYANAFRNGSGASAKLLVLEGVCATGCTGLIAITAADVCCGLSYRHSCKQVATRSRRAWGKVAAHWAGDGRPCGEEAIPPQRPDNFPGGQQQWLTYWEQYVHGAQRHFQPSSHLRIQFFMPISEYSYFSWAGQLAFLAHITVLGSSGLSVTGSASSSASVALLSVSVLSFYISTLQYSVLNQKLGILVQIIARAVARDVFMFAVIYVLFLLGFGAAIYLVSREHGTGGEKAWEGLGTGADSLIRISVGEVGNDIDPWRNAQKGLSHLAYIYHILFFVIALVILMNLIISMFSSTFTKMYQESEKRHGLHWGRRILLLERRLLLLSRCMEDGFRINHAADAEQSGEHKFVFESTLLPPAQAAGPAPGGGERGSEPSEALPQLDTTTCWDGMLRTQRTVSAMRTMRTMRTKSRMSGMSRAKSRLSSFSAHTYDGRGTEQAPTPSPTPLDYKHA